MINVGGRPKKQKIGEKSMRTTPEFIEWVKSQRKRSNQPLWEVCLSIKKELETFRKNQESLKQQQIDNVVAIPNLINIQKKQAVDIGILEDQFILEPLVILVK